VDLIEVGMRQKLELYRVEGFALRERIEYLERSLWVRLKEKIGGK
jgi:hypothetical protein